MTARLPLLALTLTLLLPLSLPAADYRVGERLPAAKAGTKGFREIQWDDLMPKGWDPMAAFKGVNLNRLQDSDPKAAELLAKVRVEWDKAPVEPALNGQRVRIPGFVVPLERKGDEVSEFLLVPYFGACVHVPPPPSNQVIHVVPAKPVKGMQTMETFWISGTLNLQGGDSGMGVYAYRLAAERVEPYVVKQGKKQ
ncbi:hypothetical protein DFR40_1425 [Azonexus fungiphilus]|uniref:DUF3299 domain-containing protein n=1 Tax=Azonexus fungiphilus TaxID=146940 RepID=A0A495WE98_9RHOO|nr:DUF3299 domain-containing protein [Azonexus fungiphilus]NHC06210.1 DUF3299 domain-containing protein [Azonexus fungiphilus]RKT59537.1 hypothetical protein DFR40_1425 [Azonexus fungiphilus]